MEMGGDFSWAEVGGRIRTRRVSQGITQQALAQAAGVTQNAIFRIEAGETNPQLTTLKGLSKALGASVREIVTGISDGEPTINARFSRVLRVLTSGDEEAVQIIENGLAAAEALIARSMSAPGMPSIRVSPSDRRVFQDREINQQLSEWAIPARLTEQGGSIKNLRRVGDSLIEVVRMHRGAIKDEA